MPARTVKPRSVTQHRRTGFVGFKNNKRKNLCSVLEFITDAVALVAGLVLLHQLQCFYTNRNR